MSHFFQWMTENTETLFWNDSVLQDELALGLERGATGVTCNPVIGLRVMNTDPELWSDRARELKQKHSDSTLEDLALMALNWTARDAALQVRRIYDATGGRLGCVVGQVNPIQMDETEPMIEQAIGATRLEPNLGVKIPATAAGMDVIEEMGARGQTVLSTISFSTAQAIAAQEAYERGRKRAAVQNGHAINYSVMIIGRFDDYLHDKAKADGIDIAESDIDLAGLAITKRINTALQDHGYPGMCLTGGTRAHHVPQLAGARMSLTINMATQQEVLDLQPEQVERGHEPIPEDVIARLRDAFPEFSMAYDDDGLDPSQFTSFGPCRAMHDWFVKDFQSIMEFVQKA